MNKFANIVVMGKIIRYIKNLFKIKSPCCNIKMESYYDMHYDFVVFECKCGQKYC